MTINEDKSNYALGGKSRGKNDTEFDKTLQVVMLSFLQNWKCILHEI